MTVVMGSTASVATGLKPVATEAVGFSFAMRKVIAIHLKKA